MKTILIKQPKGLGDILFCQKIAQTYIAQGHRVIWPVARVYCDIGEYIEGPEFVLEEDMFDFKDAYNSCGYGGVLESNDYKVICIDGSNTRNIPGHIMKSKYDTAGISYDNWQDFYYIQRNIDKENSLVNSLDLLEKKYVLTMTKIGTPPNCVSDINIPITTDLQIVSIEMIPNYSLFDWCQVIENAEELYLEGSAVIYIIEKLSTKAEANNKMFLFSRDGHAHFDGLFKKPWIWRKDNIK